MNMALDLVVVLSAANVVLVLVWLDWKAHARRESARADAFRRQLATIARSDRRRDAAALRALARQAIGILPYPARFLGGPKNGLDLDELSGVKIEFMSTVCEAPWSDEYVHDPGSRLSQQGEGDDRRCIFHYAGRRSAGAPARKD